MQSYFAPVYEQVKAHGIYIDRAHSGIPPEIRRWTMDNGRWTMDNGQWTMDNGQWTKMLWLWRWLWWRLLN
ncbi:MAG: hypothetical protein IKQ48_06110 [Paludibacteraceae bacterium]|nr:hypothetical protein [Paludibacteraceae bacterium]